MSWVAVDQNGKEIMSQRELQRGEYPNDGQWVFYYSCWNQIITLPKGSIKKLIGRDLTWEDEAVELK